MKLKEAVAFVGSDYGPSSGQLVNIVFRCILNYAAFLACWVPMRLFYKGGELAGTAMVIASAMLNFYYFVNALMWPHDDIAHWPKGYIWCDVQLASWVPLETLIAASTCAVLRNVADQVSLLRASGLTGSEKRRKNHTQALIIFPLPLLQVILYYYTIALRYNISGVIGCQAVFDPNWVFLIFFLLPCPIFSVISGYYAVLTWWRYRQIDATSRQALWNSGNSIAQVRSSRTRRKLYFMTTTIISPYLPMQLLFLYKNVSLGMPWTKPYRLSSLHRPGWKQIDYAPATVVPFTNMYVNYISVIEVVIFFIYFGRTKEAHDMYRRYLRALGLGKIFPKLNEEWFPSDGPPASFRSLWYRAKNSSSLLSSVQTWSSRATNQNEGPVAARGGNEMDNMRVSRMRLDSSDLETARSMTDAACSSGHGQQLPWQNPWVFRTTIAAHFQMPKLPSLGKEKNRARHSSDSQVGHPQMIDHPPQMSRAQPLLHRHEVQDTVWDHKTGDGQVRTRVWASESTCSTAVEDSGLGDEASGHIVWVKRLISSSSEISAP